MVRLVCAKWERAPRYKYVETVPITVTPSYRIPNTFIYFPCLDCSLSNRFEYSVYICTSLLSLIKQRWTMVI